MKQNLLVKQLLVIVFALVGFVSVWGETVTITMSDIADVSGTSGNISFSTDQGSGSTPVAYNSTGLDVRVYAGGTVTISTLDESNMTSIVFSISTQGKKRLAEITCSDGTMTVNNTPTCSWSGAAKSVTFTVGAKANYGTDGSSKAGQLDFDAFEVTYISSPTKTSVLTWSVAGDTSTETKGTVGTQLTETLIPDNPEDLSCGTFVGWSATNPGNESASTTTTEPSDLFTKTTGTKPTPDSEAVTYYAIFRKEQ